jgi:hypothetical protein
MCKCGLLLFGIYSTFPLLIWRREDCIHCSSFLLDSCALERRSFVILLSRCLAIVETWKVKHCINAKAKNLICLWREEKTLLWVISIWLFSLYQQITFRDEWIQCKIYGLFLALDPIRDKPGSCFYFALIYSICFLDWWEFVFGKQLNRKVMWGPCWGFLSLRTWWYGFYESVFHTRETDKDDVPVDLHLITWLWKQILQDF